MANCYNWDQPPSVGDYFSCALGPAFKAGQIVIVAITIILVMYMTWKSVTNRENPKVLEELPKNWLYIVLLSIVAIGGLGTVINILMKLFGFGSVGDWYVYLNEFVDKLR